MATIDEDRFILLTKAQRRKITELRDPRCKQIVRPEFEVRQPKACKLCFQVYCYACSDFLQYVQNSCTRCNQPYDPIEVPPNIKSSIGDLQLRCKFTHLGCKAVYPVNDEFNHLSICPYQKKELLLLTSLIDKLSITDLNKIQDKESTGIVEKPKKAGIKHLVVGAKEIEVEDVEEEYKTAANFSSKNKLRQLVCKKGHSLVKTFNLTDITKHKDLSFFDNKYKCDECGKDKLNASKVGVYHCDECQYDLCPNCSSKTKTNNLRKLICSRGHPMVKVFAISEITKHKETSYIDDLYECDRCRTDMLNSKKIGAYHCDICLFDLCPRCSTETQKTCMKKMMCSKGHAMVKTFNLAAITKKIGSYNNNIYTCDKCGTEGIDATKVGVYNCDICEFDLCPKCSTNSKKDTLKYLDCPKSHPLVKTFDIPSICKNPTDNSNIYHCDVCGAKNLDAKKLGTYRCDECNFDLCPACSSSSKLGKMKKYHCTQGHSMIKAFDLEALTQKPGVTYVDNLYNCDKCGKKYINAKKTGAYHCETCEYDLCPDCSSHHPKKSLRKIHCAEGHSMLKTFDLASITKHINCSYNKNMYKCDKCGSMLDAKKSGVYHCDECMYDLCPHCSKGHTLLYIQNLLEKQENNEAYKDNKYICDRCLVIQTCDSKNGVFHCEDCMFDICPTCFNEHR